MIEYTALKELLSTIDIELKSVDNVNHKPHPYCITKKHITRYGSLDADTIKALERDKEAHCGMYVNNKGSTFL